MNETSFPVKFKLSERTLDIKKGEYILEAAEEAGIEMEWGCRQGVCGACSTQAVGKVLWPDIDHCLSKKQLEEGWILTCICKVDGPLEIDE